MAKEELPEKAKTGTKQVSPQKKIAFEVVVPEHEEMVVCEVCGHQNPKNAGLCAMCSNYLFH